MIQRFSILFACISLAVTATGQSVIPSPSAEATASRLKANLGFLASDELKGRSAADDSIQEAAEYVASQMEEIGLDTKLFSGSAFQPFEIPLGATAGSKENNHVAFSLAGQDKAIQASLGDGLNPMAIGSEQGRVTGKTVFVGYGITAPKLKYDDYSGIDVSGATVIMIRKEPGVSNPESPFEGTKNSNHAFFNTKVNNAIRHGAAAIILVNDPNSVRDQVKEVENQIDKENQRLTSIQKALEQVPEQAVNSRERLQQQVTRINQLIESLEQDLLAAKRGVMAVSTAGTRPISRNAIPIVSLGRDVVGELLSRSIGKTLEELEAQIDESWQPASHPLPDTNLSLQVELTPASAETCNVVGTLAGRGDLADEIIVVGAHYDHVGLGGIGSLAPGTIAVHNGADDNASGTSSMLAIAALLTEQLKDVASHRRLVFIAFSAEERGLLGSKHYVRNPRFPLESTAAMVNLDMVGRLNNNELTVYGTGTAAGLDELVDRANIDGGFELFKEPSGYGPSDHQSFYLAKIPVLFFFTGLHGDYHRPTDDFDKINFNGMVRITDIVSDVTYQLAIQSERPAYAETEKGVQIRRQSPPQGGAFLGVSLSDRGDHVVLSGLTADGPAERSGLLIGDRLVTLGKQEIKQSSEVIEVMRNRSPGEKLPIQVLRDGKTIDFQVSLEARPRGQ